MRITLTVPPETKRRMDTVADLVNWSAVASEAFERTLNELENS